MQQFPTMAAAAEDAYRRERSAALFRLASGRSHRSNRAVTGRVRWYRRRDRAAH